MKIYPVTLSGGWQTRNGEPFWRWSGWAEAPAAMRGIAMLEQDGALRVAASGMDGASKLPIELTLVPLDEGECQVIFAVGRSFGQLRTLVTLNPAKPCTEQFKFNLIEMRTAAPGYICTLKARQKVRFGVAFVGEKYKMASETHLFEKEMMSRAELA